MGWVATEVVVVKSQNSGKGIAERVLHRVLLPYAVRKRDSQIMRVIRRDRTSQSESRIQRAERGSRWAVEDFCRSVVKAYVSSKLPSTQ
jgi:hypothetical protein